MSVSPQPAPIPATWVDPEGRNVALCLDGREYVFSAGVPDIADRIALLERWAENCRTAAAALRRCHAQFQAEQRRSAEFAATIGGLRRCALCEAYNAATRTACHWCGNPLPPTS